MSRTLTQLESALSYLIGDYVSGSASANGNAGGTTVPTTSVDVLNRPEQFWVQYFLRLTSGTYSGQSRPITDYSVAAGTGTLTVAPAFGGQVLSSVTFRIERFPNQWKWDAISDAISRITDILPRTVVEEFLTGELLRNNNFEQWRNDVPYDWEVVSGSVTRESTTIYQGRYAAKLAVSTTLRQYIPLERELSGCTLSLRAWVNGKIANGLTFRIVQGSTTTTSAAVTVDDTWQNPAAITYDVANATQPLSIQIVNGTGAVAYVDALHLYNSDYTVTQVIPISEAFTRIHKVHSRPTTASPTAEPLDTGFRLHPNQYGGYSRYPHKINIDYPVRLVGSGVWPTVSAAGDTVDILQEQEYLVAIRAGVILMDRALSQDYLGASAEWTSVKARLQAEETSATMRFSKPAGRHFYLPVR